MRVALVYDRINKLGGAEVVLAAFHQLFPQADWYTSVWDPQEARFSRSWRVFPSFLNRVPFLRRRHELVPFLMPFAFESFDLTEFDLVISIGSAECKGVITRAATLHLHYCLTPTRYLWSHQSLYLARPQFGKLQYLATPLVKTILSVLAKWDLVAATRPDQMISISKHVQKRVKKYYKRDSPVIYPPVDIKKFAVSRQPSATSHRPYYLCVSRLVPYKRVDLLVAAFTQTKRRLVVIGKGSELSRLQRQAGKNIRFLGQVAEAELVGYYQGCRALVHAGIEDFGISLVEAQAAGKPVIAFAQGGAVEIINNQETGLLFNNQSVNSLQQALDQFETMSFSVAKCQKNAKRFSQAAWLTQMQQFIKAQYAKHR